MVMRLRTTARWSISRATNKVRMLTTVAVTVAVTEEAAMVVVTAVVILEEVTVAAEVISER